MFRLLPLSLVIALVAGGRLAAQVTDDQLLSARAISGNWLTYHGAYDGWRHSRLDQITPANVNGLEMKWVLQAQAPGPWEATPLVVDGVMYVTQRPNDVVALDARTGRIFWMYRHTGPTDVRVCCGAENRGARHTRSHALHGDARRAARRARRQERAPDLDDNGRRSCARRFDHARAPCGQRQGHCRRGWRRVGHPWIRRRVRCRHGPGGVALLHGSSTRRTRLRDLVRRGVENGWRIGLAHGHVRSGAEPHLLGHRQPGTRLQPGPTSRRQPLHRFGPRARRRIPARYAGTSSSRRTTRTTTTPRRCRCSWT